MKGKKVIIHIFIFLITIFVIGNTHVTLAADAVCSDVAKDDYEFSAVLMYGGLQFKNASGQITTGGDNFLDIYDFFVDGVDIEKIREKGLEEEYISALTQLKTQMENIQGGDTIGSGGFDIVQAFKGVGKDIETEKEKVEDLLTAVGAREDQKEEILEGYNDVKEMEEAKNSTNMQNRVNSVADASDNNDNNKKNNKIYKQPNIKTGTIKEDGTLQDMISDGDKFLNAGDENTIEAESLQALSGRIYNILLEIGVGLSVIIGIILGIKFMLSGVEEKAEVKKMIWVYVVGCVVTFGSFGIWKLVVSILEQI